MKSQGYCTRNAKGLFEVHWEVEENFLTKLFKKQIHFKYTTDELNKDNWTDYLRVYSTFDWYDEGGNKVVCNKTLDKIDDILSGMVYDKWKYDL